MTRAEYLLGGAQPATSRILEIGPGYSPIAAKRGGWNTHVVDHASRDELRRKYAGAGVDLDAFEEVDTIWRDGPLDEAVATDLHGSFDLLIASHVIEHVPDFAGFLASATRLLKPDGLISLAVPDRRYCFDFFKPPSSTGDVIEAFETRRTRHSLRSLWNHTAYAITMNGVHAWGQHRATDPAFLAGFQDAARVLGTRQADQLGDYIDCHAWQFTPAAFRLIVLELGQLGLADWHVGNLSGPDGCEFLVILAKGAERIGDPDQFQQRRMTLLLEQLGEFRDQIGFAIGEPRVAAVADLIEQLDKQKSRLAEVERQLAEVQHVLGRVLRWAQPVRKLLHPLRPRGWSGKGAAHL